MSTWQDWVLSVISIVFVVVLIPSVVSKTEKPPLSTSLLTGIALIITAFVELTLSLWFSCATTVAGGLIWLLLAYQKIVEKRDA